MIDLFMVVSFGPHIEQLTFFKIVLCTFGDTTTSEETQAERVERQKEFR